VSVKDGITRKAVWKLWKYKDPKDEIAKALRNGMTHEEVLRKYGKERFIGMEEWEGNIGLNEGLNELCLIISGNGTPTKWDSGNARVGVGNGTATPVATQTGLQGGSKLWKPMDSTYPSVVNQTISWKGTFGSLDANWAWEEYTVVNASDDTGKNLNRCTTPKGTKIEGETWSLQLDITFQ